MLPMDLSFILNELGEERDLYYNAVAPPVLQTSNFAFHTVADLRKALADEYDANLYSRGNNPTVDMLRKKLAALDGAETVVFQGTNANDASTRAHLVLPSAAYVEREGTFTNFQGRVQRFRTALEPLGDARPDWLILSMIGKALGFQDPVFSAERAEQVFNALVSAVPAFGGMTYRSIGDAGAPAKA